MPAPATDATSVNIATQHEDMIHDSQLDFYGKRLATCSSDRTIKIFDVGTDGQYSLVDTLRGHDGSVWQVSWAHPKFGSILASCSYDGKVIVWKEGDGASSGGGRQAGGGWQKIKEHTLHTASVNSISWAPHELGPILACASSDGKISVLTFNNDGTWDAPLFDAHSTGANAVSWAPAVLPGSLIQPQGPQTPGVNVTQAASGADGSSTSVKRFASGGCDGLVRIWGWRENTKTWAEEEVLEGHSNWVRDVAWAPNIGLPRSYLASAGQDKTVQIWIQDHPRAPWNRVQLDPSTSLSSTPTPAPGGSANAAPGSFPDVVWRVSWSITGNVLAVACGDGKVSLWKENLKGKWECVSDLAA